MKYSIWEIRQECFDVLINHLGYSERMKGALRDRYNENCSFPRNVTCITNDVSEHGLMKAEKKLLKAHSEIIEVYGTRY